MAELVLDAKIKKYRNEVNELENKVKDWKESCFSQISDLAEECYNGFNEVQMNISKLSNNKKEKYQLASYKNAYNFLVFIETRVNIDFCTFLINNSVPFHRLIEHYSKYCTKIEKQYNIELESEKRLSSNG